MTRFKVAAVQMTSGLDKTDNLDKAVRFVEAAAREGASLVVLPEMFLFWGDLRRISEAAETIPGPATERLAEIAARNKVHLIAGSIPEAHDSKPYNTSVLFDSAGAILAKYRKLHLMKVCMPGKQSYDEADYVTAGDGTPVVCRTPLGVIGLSICYDLRFPELYVKLFQMGAEIITIPSAFSTATGEAHWHVLIRARAIETQSYVIAPNQIGQSGKAPENYGHSLVVDPRGTIVAEKDYGEGFFLSDISLDRLRSLRRELPSLAQRPLC
jgi:predicted amidohydrolase